MALVSRNLVGPVQGCNCHCFIATRLQAPVTPTWTPQSQERKALAHEATCAFLCEDNCWHFAQKVFLEHRLNLQAVLQRQIERPKRPVHEASWLFRSRYRILPLHSRANPRDPLRVLKEHQSVPIQAIKATSSAVQEDMMGAWSDSMIAAGKDSLF